MPEMTRKITGITQSTYRTKNVHREWRKAISEAGDGALVFSPYVTSKTAESVLGNLTTVDLHLLFDAEQFASGASSLKALRRLIDGGHRIFHVPNLHAKIFIVPGEFLSVGSQNLTYSGTVRREMTVTTGAAEATQAAIELVGPWLLDRTPVTCEMIDEMEKLVEPVQLVFRSAQQQAATAQEQFLATMAAKEAERLASLERLRQQRDGQVERLGQLKAALADRRQSVEDAFGVVVRMRQGNERHSLIVGADEDLTSWRVDDKLYELKALHRYLCVMEDNGRIGWARVARSRITFVEPWLESPRAIHIKGTRVMLKFNCERTDSDQRANVTIALGDPHGTTYCEVEAWYRPGALEVLTVRPASVQKDSSWAWHPLNNPVKLAAWIEKHPERFSKLVLPGFTEPFRYREGNADGPEAHEFFGPVNSVVMLRVVLENTTPVLVAKLV